MISFIRLIFIFITNRTLSVTTWQCGGGLQSLAIRILRFAFRKYCLGSRQSISFTSWAALVFSRPVGIVAALMLATHGTHIFWSQNARAYAPGAALGLLATWLLLKISSEEKPGPFLCAGYVAAIVAGVQTTELIWALFGVHIGWVVLRGGGEAFSWKGFAPKRWFVWRVSRLAYLQSAALMLSLPALLHSAYGAVRGYTRDPDPSFLVEYAAFGFAFIMGAYVDLNHAMPPALPVSGCRHFSCFDLFRRARRKAGRQLVANKEHGYGRSHFIAFGFYCCGGNVLDGVDRRKPARLVDGNERLSVCGAGAAASRRLGPAHFEMGGAAA